AIDESAGQAGVAGTIAGLGHGYSVCRRRCRSLGYSYRWVPCGNGAINCREDECGWFSWGQQKICLAAVGDGAGWGTRWRVLITRIGRRDGDYQGLLRSRSVVKSAEPSCFIRNPPGAGGVSG